MDKPKVKVCDHFNVRKLKDFEKAVMNRDQICCDKCFPRGPTSREGEGLVIENLLMCLSCFEVGCNRHTEGQCMLLHGEKHKHHVTYSLSFGMVWCYLCDYELKEFLIANQKGDNEKFNQKYDKLEEYLKEVDSCFTRLLEKQKENARKREELKAEQNNKIEEEKDSELELLEKRRADSKSF